MTIETIDTIYDKDNPLHAFAKWTAEVDGNWTEAARHTAKRCFIDIIACMVPGAAEAVTEKVFSLAKLWGIGDVTAIGYSDTLSAPMAALVNGTSAHALDFDDNFDPAKAHATAVLAPALLALADQLGKNGEDLIDAYIVGLQIIGRVGQGVNPYHRNRGWHSTATTGAVGSAAGCARLLGLNWQQTAHAISIATSTAGGFMSQFGTMTKPIHAGFAAAGAVQAACMAQAGITAGDQTLHGKTGMGTLMVGPDVEALRAGMIGFEEHGQNVTFRTKDIGEPLMIEKYGLKVKRYANCGSLHRALDGLLELREKHGLTPDNVAAIHVRAPASHLRNLMYDNPIGPMQAKFSLEYGMAVGLLRGRAGLLEYSNEAVEDKDIRALMDLTTKDYIEKLESEFPTEVHVTLKSGEKVSTSIKMPIGSIANPLSDDQLWDKFSACLEGQIPEKNQIKARNDLANLESIANIASLMQNLQIRV